MQKLLDNFQESVEAFVEQRDDLIMLVACSENEAAIALKLVQDVEQRNATDVFLLFADDFTAPQPYVDVAIERLREQHRIACDGLIEQDREPLPPIPKSLDDTNLSPVRRLGAAMMYARSLVPPEGEHRLIWTMFPQRINDRDAYLEMVSAFAPYKGIKPGMRGLRLIFRDEADCESYRPELAGAPRVRIQQLDLSQEMIEDALTEEVEDEALPDERRMQSLLNLALFDSAYNRKLGALHKFKILLGHYQHSGNAKMQAFVLNAVGDVYHRNDELDRAQHWYECAVPPAVEAKDPVIFHTIVRNLGDVAFKKAEYTLAEQHYDSADQLASKMLDPEAKIRDLEWRGLSQERQDAYDRAIASWENAATLSRSMGLPIQLKANLEHLVRGYRKTGSSDRLSEVETEMAELKTEETSS